MPTNLPPSIDTTRDAFGCWSFVLGCIVVGVLLGVALSAWCG